MNRSPTGGGAMKAAAMMQAVVVRTAADGRRGGMGLTEAPQRKIHSAGEGQ